VLLAVSIVLALFILFPLYWMIVASLQPDTLRLQLRDLLPTQFTLDNYLQLFAFNPAAGWAINSLVVSSVAMVGALFTSATAGYVFGKKQFWGRQALFILVIGTMALPTAVLLIPRFLIVAGFGWLNSYQGMIAPMLAFPFGVFLVRQFMHAIPNDLIDAAKIDGASELRVFTAIIVPLSKPALGAVAIFAFIQTWSDYLWQLVVATTPGAFTLPVGVASVAVKDMETQYGVAMAGATISFLPMLVIFLLFQRYFVKGISTGAVKG
jgi:multiple sugar transport system permease protein